MKSLIVAAAIFAATGAPAIAQTSVSIDVGQPNFYGHIELGGYAPPPVYSTRPVVIERRPRQVGQPVYLRVPQGHRKHWSKHCREYNACGQQVFFVQDGWYSNTYAPRYREQRERDRGHDRSHGHDRGHERDDGHGNGKHGD